MHKCEKYLITKKKKKKVYYLLNTNLSKFNVFVDIGKTKQ